MATTDSALPAERYRRIRRDAATEITETIVRDPPDGELSRAIPRYVRRWSEEHYEDLLGAYDPETVESAVPTDLDEVESSGSTPLSNEGIEEERRRELYAARAVRADLTATLRERADDIERAVAVHDALERLVGARGGHTDRRPSELVEAFADWVARRRGEAAAERARAALTPLHVMRIDGLDVVDLEGDPADRQLLAALEAWLEDAEPAVFDPPPGVDRG